jgi:L-rhamnonate dehydratase
MRIRAVRAMAVQERVLWARSVEKTVSLRAFTHAPASVTALPRPRGPRTGPANGPGSVLVEIVADDGIFGIGIGGGGWPGALVVQEYLTPLLLDEDPHDTEHLWERMYRSTARYGQAGIALMAISGVDLALWDLKAKAMGQPVYQLLGGRAREAVPVYATVRDPQWAQAQGFVGIKLGGPFGPEDGREGQRGNEEAVAAIRELVGPDMDIMIDCSSTWGVAYTLEMARILAPYRIAFIEEPVGPEDVDGYATLRRRIGSTLIAGGEHAYTRYGARRLLERGAVDILQPDIRWTGGLSETLKICDLAAAHNVPIMPHRGGMAWALHLILARPDCPLAEGLTLTDEEAACSLFDGEPVPREGLLSVGDAPGFGLTMRAGPDGQRRLEELCEPAPWMDMRQSCTKDAFSHE